MENSIFGRDRGLEIDNFVVRYGSDYNNTQLTKSSVVNEYRDIPTDMLIMETMYSTTGEDVPFDSQDILEIKTDGANDKLVIGYMSLGSIDHNRDRYSQDFASYDTEVKDEEGNNAYFLKYWDEGIKSSFEKWIDNLQSVGFDGAYFDVVNAAQKLEIPEATEEAMMRLILHLAEYAHQTDPDFKIVVGHNPGIIANYVYEDGVLDENDDTALIDDFRNAVDAFTVEATPGWPVDFAQSDNPSNNMHWLLNQVLPDPDINWAGATQLGIGFTGGTDFTEESYAALIQNAGFVPYATGVNNNTQIATFFETHHIYDGSLPLPNISIADASVEEGGELLFDVSLDDIPTQPITLQYQITNGSASNDDYIQPSGELVISAGETLRTIKVQTSQDTDFESDETFTLTIVSASGTPVSNISATGTILNDDGVGPIIGTPGQDIIDGTQNADTIYAKAGNDTVNGLQGDDFILGDEGDDILNGDGGEDDLYGWTGNDILNGGADDDLLSGEDGDDTLNGGTGDDDIYGGANIDTVSFADDIAGVTVNLGSGSATGTLSGNDRLYDIENVIGGMGSDTITGNALANDLDGGAGDDFLDGGDGNDRILYDVVDNAANVTGGAGSDTLVVLNMSAPLSYDLVAGDFEVAEVIEIDAGSQDWSTITDVYNDQWVRTDEDTLYDDSSTRHRDYDWDNSKDWSSIRYDYQADGDLDIKFTSNDDGSSVKVLYDPDNASNWTRIIDNFDNNGDRFRRTTERDDGTELIQQFDFDSSKDWDNIIDYYDANGDRYLRQKFNDDDTYVKYNYDFDSTKSWSEFQDTFEANDEKSSRLMTYDDGTDRKTLFDWDNSKSWETQIVDYNVNDEVTDRRYNWDDGAYRMHEYDVDDVLAWDEHIQHYDTAGNFVSEEFI